MNKLKAKRDQLVLEILGLAIQISETKDYSAYVDFSGNSGMIDIGLRVPNQTITLFRNWDCFYRPPLSERAWNEKYFPLDYKSLNKELTKCKQIFSDLLADKIQLTDKIFESCEVY